MNNPIDILQALELEPELALLVSQPPITFHRSFVDITGSALAALLLSAYLDQQESLSSIDGWFEINSLELEYRTGLSRREQMTARKTLVNKQIVRERKSTFPAKLEIRIDFDKISHEILQVARSRTQRTAEPFSDSHQTSTGHWAIAH
jgi:hypothetical protein